MNDAKLPVDVAAAGVAVATFFEWLPSVASLLTIIWMIIRIYETDTVQRLLGRKKK